MGTTITTAAGDIAYSAGPAGVFFAVIVAAEVGMLVSKKTKIDILVTPIVALASGLHSCQAYLSCRRICDVLARSIP